MPARDPGSLDPSIKGTCHSQTFDLLTPSDLPSDGPTGLSAADDVGVVVQGDSTTQSYLPLLMIVVGFDGQPYDSLHDWNDYVFAGNRSVSQYYTDMSFGKFTFLPVQETSAFDGGDNTNQADKPNDGVVHVSLDQQKTKGWAIYYDDEADHEMLAAFSQALAQAGNYVDFASYDSNGDGAIQTSELAICFVVSGIDAAYHSSYEYDDESRYIWPHAWVFFDGMFEDITMPVVDGVAIDQYVAMAEYRDGDGDSLVEDSVGTLSHELGHYIGLPDLYDTSYNSSGTWGEFNVDALSLMNYGCYGEDLEGNPIQYSLDMWSRVTLGWVEPAALDAGASESARIAGSLSDTGTTIAYRIDTPNEGEYYLIENRRFTSWDKGMGRFYSSGATDGDSSEDYGGGLVLWHIDDNIVQAYKVANTINNTDHHPGVMPLFFEEDNDKNLCTIGSYPDYQKPFFDSDGWGRDVPLPLYGTMPGDTSADRTLSADLVLSLDGPSAPVTVLHLHRLCTSVTWADDFSSASLWGVCQLESERVELATTTDVTAEVARKPSTTEMGKMAYTARFARYGLKDTTYGMIPPLGEDAVSARDAALAALAELITGANATLAQGAYTPESFDALRGAIKAANALYEDDTATEDDVAAVREELLRMWRLLVPVSPAQADPTEQQERQARLEAAYLLAEQLSGVCDEVDPQAYKPVEYAAFAQVVDAAYGVLASEGSTTQELLDARLDVQKALALLKRDGKRIDLSAATVSGLKRLTYNGKARKPRPVVTLGGNELVAGTDYQLRYANNKGVGAATVTVVGMGDYIGEASGTFVIAKAANPLSVKGKAAKLSYAKVRKATQRLGVSKVVKFANKGRGKITYAKASGNAKISVNKTTSKVSVRKGLKKGTYLVKVRIKAAGTSNYKSATKTVIVMLTVG